jgi:hypothetical protein
VPRGLAVDPREDVRRRAIADTVDPARVLDRQCALVQLHVAPNCTARTSEA